MQMHCKANAKFFKQNNVNLDIYHLLLYQKKISDNSNAIKLDIVKAHLLLKKDVRPNYAGLQIPIKSKITYELLAEYLKYYWDWQLPFLVEFGFPLDIDTKKIIETDQINHKSAIYLRNLWSIT